MHSTYLEFSKFDHQYNLNQEQNAYTYIGQAVEIWKTRNGRQINGHNRKSLRN